MDLFRFAICTTGDERERCRQFKEGLQFDIRTIVATSWYTKFIEIVEAIRRVGQTIAGGRTVQALKQKRS